MEQSLLRFKNLLLTSSSATELRRQLETEFMLYRSPGRDGQGTVKFTGYFRPVYQASRTQTPIYRFPIYRVPATFNAWHHPQPTRVELEGPDGLGRSSSPAFGAELAWFHSRYEAFMVQVQGSAVLEFTDGTKSTIGFAAATDYPFTGMQPRYFSTALPWNNLTQYFNAHPAELNRYLAVNNRVVFFQEKPAQEPIGCLGVPVIPERSIATDKTVLPPGAIGLIQTQLPFKTDTGRIAIEKQSRLVLDQDTGSAIRGAGRVDVFMGTGSEAQQKANSVSALGGLYYLLLKN